jgi:hypothetical protein
MNNLEYQNKKETEILILHIHKFQYQKIAQ